METQMYRQKDKSKEAMKFRKISFFVCLLQKFCQDYGAVFCLIDTSCVLWKKNFLFIYEIPLMFIFSLGI